MRSQGSITVALVAVAQLAAACGCGHTGTPAPIDEAEPSLVGQEGDDLPPPTVDTPPPAGSAGAALLAEVDRELQRKTASTYSHKTHVDEASGTFEYDCSGLLRYALSRAAPDALDPVKSMAGRPPRSAELVTFLQGIPLGQRAGRWQRVGRVRDLAPGDVVVWLKPADSRSTNTGHTMIVHGSPTPEPGHADAYVVPVVDSTALPHVPGDAREEAHQTGLGSGEIVLIVDGDGAPVRYRWSRGARSREKVTTIALGRLR